MTDAPPRSQRIHWLSGVALALPLGLTIALFLCSGCESRASREIRREVKERFIGLTPGQLEAKMGKPDHVDGNVWTYVQAVHYDGGTCGNRPRKLTTFVFKEGEVVEAMTQLGGGTFRVKK